MKELQRCRGDWHGIEMLILLDDVLVDSKTNVLLILVLRRALSRYNLNIRPCTVFFYPKISSAFNCIRCIHKDIFFEYFVSDYRGRLGLSARQCACVRGTDR